MTDFRKGTETQYPSTAQESCIHVLTPAYLPAAENFEGVFCGEGAKNVKKMMAASYDIEFSWQESFHKSTRPRLSKSSDIKITPTARDNSVLPANEHWNYADRRAVLYSSRIRKLSGKTNWHR
ncbi:hypothetical protein pdam_00005944 [Pocillopora damicornis]|uniref:Uncharacterized protein n=1 Tax=Pocillopora damicornis TaxID=46731 RepID=A0A3M6TDK3_POCDA|nr:hypothetical protein pdam_00005944 [Pocillopora damicornis]